jgi:hypothetical protein
MFANLANGAFGLKTEFGVLVQVTTDRSQFIGPIGYARQKAVSVQNGHGNTPHCQK